MLDAGRDGNGNLPSDWYDYRARDLDRFADCFHPKICAEARTKLTGSETKWKKWANRIAE